MYEQFTDRARMAMGLANQEALALKHDYIGTEHILLGLMREGRGIGFKALEHFGVDLQKVRQELENLVKQGSEPIEQKMLSQTPRAKLVIQHAIEEARQRNVSDIDTGYMLLGLIRDKNGLAAHVLANLGLEPEAVRAQVEALANDERANEAEWLSPRDRAHKFWGLSLIMATILVVILVWLLVGILR
ncbi:MAG: Clp protease N-terminal domain-containing protein [Phycisphaeraceae bacterium]